MAAIVITSAWKENGGQIHVVEEEAARTARAADAGTATTDAAAAPTRNTPARASASALFTGMPPADKGGTAGATTTMEEEANTVGAAGVGTAPTDAAAAPTRNIPAGASASARCTGEPRVEKG